MPYIGKSPSVGLRTRYNYTATAGQTSFSGADNSNVTLTYTDTNYTDVYLNGTLLLAVTDYTSTTGTTIVLASAASLNDILEVVVYDVFSVADTVSSVDGGTFKGNVNFSTDVDVDGTTNLDVVDIDGAVNMATTALVTGVLTTTAATVFNGGFAANAASTITTTGNDVQLNLISTDADALNGPRFVMQRTGSAAASGDLLGRIEFYGSDAANNATEYARIGVNAFDATAGSEDGAYFVSTRINNATKSRMYMPPTETVFNEESADIDFRVESNAHNNIFFIDGGHDGIGIGNSTIIDWSTNYPGLQMGQAGSLWGHKSSNQMGFSMNWGITTGNVFIADGIASRMVMDTSKIAFDSSASGSAGGAITAIPLFNMTPTAGSVFNNDRGGVIDFRVASGANNHMLFVDAGNDVVTIGGATGETGDTFSVTEAGANSINTRFINTNADANGVRIVFEKISGSPANNDELVQLDFMGRDSAGNAELYAGIQAFIDDVTSGTEDGVLRFSTITNATFNNRLDILPNETVFNEGGVGGVNFRIESDTNQNMFLIDSGDNTIAIGTTNTSLAVQNSETGVNFTHVGRIFTCATDHHDMNVQDDGEIIRFRSAANNEGNINVSGSTVALTGFSGRHESSGVATDTVVGTVVSTIDELDIYAEGTGPKAGQVRHNHAKIKVSDTAGDKRVYGVIANFDEYNSPIVAALGIAPVRVTGSCAGGDLLESNGDGTAKVQSDDIVRSKTLGKVTIGNSSTGVKLVSCVMYCG